MIGSRNNEDGRFFNGLLSELLVFNRSLNASEMDGVQAYLNAKWPRSQAPLNCNGPPLNCTLPIPLEAAKKKLSSFIQAMRNALFSDERYELSHAILAQQSLHTWEDRCSGLNNGTIAALVNRASYLAANQLYVSSATALFDGLNNAIEAYAGSSDSTLLRIFEIWQASALIDSLGR